MEGWQQCIFVVVGLIALLLLILIPMSFSDLDYYQYGFLKRKSTGAVDLSKVYSTGKHMVGPDYEFKVFPSTAHVETLQGVAVFTKDRLEVRMTAHFQYFLRPEDLADLHTSYDLYYKPIMRTSAQDALKGAATVFTLREMFGQRARVEEELFKAVRERLGGKCCILNCEKSNTCAPGCTVRRRCSAKDKGLFATVKFFQLGQLSIPDDVESRFLRALTLQEDTEREQLLQDATIVRKTTEAEVNKIQNQVREISNNATAQSNLIAARADAKATATVEKARYDGLRVLFQKTGLSTTDYKNSFDYLRTLKDMDKAHLSVDFDQLIVGPMSTRP